MESTQSEKSFPTNFELSKEGIPFVNHEGKKVESKQFKQLIQLTGREQAIKTYAHIKQLESDEFKESQARDENGELILAWHGSPRKFDEFKLDSKGQWSWRNKGIHFSTSKELIQEYADKARSRFKLVCNSILRRLEKVTPESPWNEERFGKVARIYNEVVEDLIENGENSRYYHKEYRYDQKTDNRHFRDPSLDHIENPLGGHWATDYFLEIFGGKIPTKESTVFDDKFGYYGVKVYRGTDIGAYNYLTVLNITNPFRKQTYITDMDDAFEDGERSHEQNRTDGSVLSHPTGWGKIKINPTKELCSIAVFDPSQIRIIGREEDGKFVVLSHQQKFTT